MLQEASALSTTETQSRQTRDPFPQFTDRSPTRFGLQPRICARDPYLTLADSYCGTRLSKCSYTPSRVALYRAKLGEVLISLRLVSYAFVSRLLGAGCVIASGGNILSKIAWVEESMNAPKKLIGENLNWASS